MGGLLGALREAEKPIYIVVAAKGVTDGSFPLKGYAGPSGRLDVAARTYISILEDTFTLAVLLLGPPNPPRLLLAPSRCKSSMVSSEKSFMLQAKLALQRHKSSCFPVYDLTSGIEGVEAFASAGRLVYLSEEGVSGDDAIEAIVKAELIAMGGHTDPPPDIHARLKSRAYKVVSIAPLSYHTDHVAAFVSWLRLAFK